MKLEDGSIRRMTKRDNKDLKTNMVLKRDGTRERARGMCVCLYGGRGGADQSRWKRRRRWRRKKMGMTPPLPPPLGLCLDCCGLWKIYQEGMGTGTKPESNAQAEQEV